MVSAKAALLSFFGLLAIAGAARAQSTSPCAARHQANAVQERMDSAALRAVQTEFNMRGFPALNAHLDELVAMVQRSPSDLDAPCDGRTYIRTRDMSLGLILSAAAAKPKDGAAPAQVTVLGISPYAQAAFLAGSTYVERGDWTRADALLRRGLENAPADAPLSNEEALTLCHLGKPVEAVAIIDRAIGANPLLDKLMHARLLRTRGYALGDAGRFDEAIAAYQQSLGLEPNHGGAQNEIVYLNKRKAGGGAQTDVTYHGEQAKSVVPQN